MNKKFEFDEHFLNCLTFFTLINFFNTMNKKVFMNLKENSQKGKK